MILKKKTKTLLVPNLIIKTVTWLFCQHFNYCLVQSPHKTHKTQCFNEWKTLHQGSNKDKRSSRNIKLCSSGVNLFNTLQLHRCSNCFSSIWDYNKSFKKVNLTKELVLKHFGFTRQTDHLHTDLIYSTKKW